MYRVNVIKTFYAWPLGKTDENSPEYLSLFTFTIIRRCDDVKLFTSIIIPVSASSYTCSFMCPQQTLNHAQCDRLIHFSKYYTDLYRRFLYTITCCRGKKLLIQIVWVNYASVFDKYYTSVTWEATKCMWKNKPTRSSIVCTLIRTFL